MALPTPLQGSFGSERSVEDILAGRLRIRLAGEWHTLPVLTVGQNADWLETLEDLFRPVVEKDDGDAVGIMTALAEADDRLLELVYSYDVMGLLPPRETIERDCYPHEILKAVMEVRLAANPTAGFALAQALAEMREEAKQTDAPAPSTRTSSSRRRTAGRTARSGTR